MSNKPYIQVRDSFFKVVTTEKGIDLVKVSPEEAVAEEMEKIVLSDVDEMQVSMFQEIIDKARNDLKTSLERNLKSTVLSSLGFEKDSWGRGEYRVDHCNGRMSAVTDLISSEVRDRLLQVEIGKDFDLSVSEKKSLKKEMEKDFKEVYRRKVRELTWKHAEQLAEDSVTEWVQDLMKDKVHAIASAMLEKTLKSAK